MSLDIGGAEHVALWDAINALVDASGGRNGVSTARMTAVAKVESALRAALAEAEGAEPVAFPPSMRREVERQIAAIENPAGMQLNDGKERPILPAGTLRRMLAVIDSRPPSRNSLEPRTQEGCAMTKAERVCRVLAAADAPLTAEDLLARDPELGDLQALRVSLCNYVRYEWLLKVTARKPIRYGLHPEWRRRVSFVITETPSDTDAAVV